MRITQLPVVSEVREYTRGEFGFSYLDRQTRQRVRKVTLQKAERSAENARILLAQGQLSKTAMQTWERSHIATDFKMASITAAMRPVIALALHTARHRAKEKGWPCTLKVAHVIELGERQGWRCAVTGMPFVVGEKTPEWHKSPASISFDRLDCAGGYTPENIRLVCVCVNIVINEWGLDVFSRMCRAFVDLHGASF